VQTLFAFEQILEIFKPAPQRRFGYFCLPVLAGERLISRVDLKANKKAKQLDVLSIHYAEGERNPSEEDREATRIALQRHACSLGLRERHSA
jgi:uncharacterized protein YcaQ